MFDFKKHIADNIKSDIDKQLLYSAIINTADDSMGDYSLPCFKFAGMLRKSPVMIAEQLKNDFVCDKYICDVKAVNGYLNFYVNRSEMLTDTVCEILNKGEEYGNSTEGNGKTICLDYSSVNIAKSLHIGHLGTTAIGGSLYKLFGALGYHVVGINHLGDYGTQFGKMIVAYKLWGNDETIKEQGVKALQDLYVRFHREEEEHPELTEQARQWFVRIEKGEEEAVRLFEYFKKITLDDVKVVYDRLNVKFDSWNGESFYNDKMDKPLQFLESKGLVTVSDGAKVVDLSEYNMPPCLLVKSDGSSLYATRDIAAAFYRKETYNFDKCLYVVAYQQDLHFRQIFKVLELAGLPWAKDMVHVAYGMVSLEEGSMSTRKGNTVFLKDVLDKAVAKCMDIICAKNPDLPNKEKVAEQVGVGAVIFSALENARIKDITFTFDRVLNFDGETAPYLQYTHARCRSLFTKAGMSYLTRIARDYSGLDDVETLRLVKLLRNFPNIVSDSAYKYEPSILSKYLIDLAQAFNRFYIGHRVICEDLSIQNARLSLVECVQLALRKGLALLGIEAPEQM
ncbi:MAG TPA: arginine--tRNA ligase [Candidatus Limihabitans stercoravium]|nr:arginine--tRNA ligase [Candidatus Limihabitans stercoravium]